MKSVASMKQRGCNLKRHRLVCLKRLTDGLFDNDVMNAEASSSKSKSSSLPVLTLIQRKHFSIITNEKGYKRTPICFKRIRDIYLICNKHK